MQASKSAMQTLRMSIGILQDVGLVGQVPGYDGGVIAVQQTWH